jgi:hypothetical protein
MAGFRAKTVSVHPTVEGFARAAVRYLDPPSLCTLLEAILDRLDMKAAQAAMKEKGRHIPLAELKKTLGL